MVFKKTFSLLTVFLFLASSNLSTVALAEGARHAAFEQFQLENPGLDKKELNQMFKQEWRMQRANDNDVRDLVNPVDASAAVINNQNNIQQQIDRNDFATKAEWQAAKQAFKLEQKAISNNLNQTIQQTSNNKLVNINHGFSLDLTSAVESITLGDKLFQGQNSVVINVGGQDKTVSAGSKVTAAEYVAARQALGGGSQTVTLDADGRATGGQVDLSAMTSGNQTMKVRDLTVPVAVTASGDFGKGGDVRILGDLTNAGSIVAYSSDKNINNAGIFADNITNTASGNITSQLNDVAKNNGGVVSDLNLSLRANDFLTNYGNIDSAGDLNLSAGISVKNIGASSVLTAAKTVNIETPHVVNQGSVAALGGNVNIAAPLATDLYVSGYGGNVQALSGDINIGTAGQVEKINTTIHGGDWKANSFNITSGDGHILVQANSIDAPVNATAGSGVIGVTQGDMTTGRMTFSGDPIIFSQFGNVNLTDQVAVGAPITILAGQNITGSAQTIFSGNSSGSGGDITLIAGANISAASGRVIVSGATLNGGKIELPNLTTLDSSGSIDGGDVLLVAFKGSISLSPSLTIQTGGGGSGVNGNVTAIAGATSGTGISLPSINTTGGTGGGGNVTLANATPTIVGPFVEYSGTTGALVSGSFGIGTRQSGATLFVNQITAGNGNVSLLGGSSLNSIQVNSANSFSASSLGTLDLGSTSAQTISGAASGDITLFGSLAAPGGILLVSGQDIVSNALVTSNISLNASRANGDAGNISMVAGAAYTENANNVQVTGRSATGGSINLTATTGSVSTQVTSGSGSGGAVNLIAYTDAGFTQGGQILMPGYPIATDGSIVSGDVNVVAERPSATAIQLNTVNTMSSNPSNQTGNIYLRTATPFSTITFSTLTPGFAGTNNSFMQGTLQAGDIISSTLTAQGGLIRIESGRNIQIGNITNNIGTGLGGNVTILTNGTSALQVGGAGANFTGTISANVDTTGMVRTISITNLGTAGIDVISLPTQSVTTQGRGGSLILDADNGTLTVSGTIDRNGVGTNSDGGSIILRGASIANPSGNLFLTANATGTGSGGSTLVETETGAITVGTGATQIRATANGTGGTVEFRSGGGMSVQTAISADHVILQSSGGGLFFNNSVTGNSDVTLTTLGSSTMSGTGSINTNVLNINADSGAVTLFTGATSVSINTNSTVTLTEDSDLTINAGTTGAGDLNISTIGNQNFNGNFSAANYLLTVNGNFSLGGTGVLSSAGQLNITSLSPAGQAVLNTDVATLVAGFEGAVEINEANSISLGNTLSVTHLRVNAGGSINVNGAVTAQRITLLSKGEIAIANDISALGGGAGSGLLLVAAGNIRTSAANVDITTGVSGGQGGNIVMIAGADYVNAGASSIQITGASALGGNINFDTTDISSLRTSSVNAGSSGGDLTLVAYNSANPLTGRILLPSSSSLITSGNGGASGNVVVVGSGTGTQVQIGAVNTSGGTSGGSIDIATSTLSNPVFVSTGMPTYTAGAFFDDLGPGAITTGALTTSSGNVWVRTDGAINLGAINTTATVSGAKGGDVRVGGDDRIANLTLSTITANGLGSGRGGDVVIDANGLVVGVINANGGATGAGGSVIATHTNDNFATTVFDELVSAAGNGGGNGGTIRLKNLGIAGLRISGNDIAVGTGGSIGGTIELDAGTGQASTRYLIISNANWNVTGTTSNGQILLTGNSIEFTGAGPATLNAGSTSSTSGLVQLNSSGANTGLNIRTYGNNLNLSGGTVTVNDAIRTVGGNLTVNAGTGGFSGIYVSTSDTNPPNGASGNIIINSAGNIDGGTFDTSTSGSATTAGSINLNLTFGTGTIDSLNLFAMDGNTGTNTITVAANSGSLLNLGSVRTNGGTVGGNISITNSGTGGIDASDLVAVGTTTKGDVTLSSSGGLSSASVYADQFNVNFVSGSATFTTEINSFNATAPSGSLTINERDGVDIGVVSLNSLTVNAGNFAAGSIVATANISVPGTLTLHNANGAIQLNNSISGTTSVTLDAEGGITQLGGTISGGLLTVNMANGISTLTTNVSQLRTNVATGSTLSIQEANGIELLDIVGDTITVTAGMLGAGNITTANDISVGTLELVNQNSSSNIVLSNNIDATSQLRLTVTGNGNISQTAGTLTASQFIVNVGDGSFEHQGGTSAQIQGVGGFGPFIDFNSNNGNLNVENVGPGSLTFLNFVGNSLTAKSSTIELDNGIFIGLTNDANLLTNVLNLHGSTIDTTNGVITVSSISGGLTVDGGSGGVLNSTKYAPGSPGFPNTPGVVLNSNGGYLTIADDVTVAYDSEFNVGNRDLIVSNSANWYSDYNISVNARNIEIQGAGQITANDLIFTSTAHNGTIINTSGDVTLTSDLTFNGQDLAIIASGNIIASGITSINLNSSSGNGGNLHLIAGYNATPSSGGQIQTSNPFTITTAGTGSVNLGSVTINTSATGATGDAGDVVAVASNGSVSLGDITATSTNGVGGNVLVVGQTGVNVTEINVTGGSAGGNIELSVSAPQIVGGPIKITDGAVENGSFAAGTTATAGNLLFRGTTGADEVTFRTGSGTVNQIFGGVLRANTLNFLAGTGAVLLDYIAVGTVNSDSQGSVTLNNQLGNVILGNITGANQHFILGTAQNITTSSDISIEYINLAAVSLTSQINLLHNITGSSGVTLYARDSFTQTSGTKISGGDLVLGHFATTTLATNVNTLSTSGTSTATLTINEDNGIQLLGQSGNVRVNTLGAGNITTGNNMSLTAIVLDTSVGGGNIILGHNVTGSASVELRTGNGGSITQNAGKISGGVLTVSNPGGNTTLSTNVTSLAVQDLSSLVINEDDGIAIGGNTNGGSLTVNAGVVTAGVLSTNATVAVGAGSITLNSQSGGGSIQLNNSLNSSGSISLTAVGDLSQTAGKITADQLTIHSGGSTAVTLSTDINQFNAGGIFAPLTINEDNGIAVRSVVGYTANNLTINSGVVSPGNITTAGNISVNAGLTLNAQGAGSDIVLSHSTSGNAGTSVVLSAADTIQQTAGTITAGSLTVGFANGSVSLNTNVNQLTTTGGDSLTVTDVNGVILNAQAVTNLTVNTTGPITTNTNISIAGLLTLNASGSGNINLNHDVNGTTGVTLNALGTISQTIGTTLSGGALSVGFGTTPLTLKTNVSSLTTTSVGSLTINEDNGIQLNAQTVGSLTVNAGLLATGNITTGAAITTNTLVLDNDNSSASSIILSHDVTGTTSATLRATGDITNAVGTSLTAATFSADAIGNIGAGLATPFNINSSNITARSTNGSVALSNAATGNVNVQTNSFANAANGTWSLTSVNAGGTTTNVTGDITANNISVVSQNGSLSASGNLQATSTLTLGAANDITNAAFTGTLTGSNLVLSSTLGSIGSADGSVRFVTSFANVEADAAGSVYLTGNNAGGTTINGTISSAGNVFDALAAQGNLTVGSGTTVSGSTIRLRSANSSVVMTGNATASSSVSLTAANDIMGTGLVTATLGGIVSLTATNGNIAGDGVSTNFNTAAGTLTLDANNAYISNTGNMQLAGANFGGTGTISVTNAGNLNVISSVSADSVSLTTTSGGNLLLSAGVTGVSDVTLTSAGTIGNSNSSVISTADITFNSVSNIGSPSAHMLVTNSGSPLALKVNTNADWWIDILDNSLVNLNASTGDDGTLVATGGVNTNGNTTLTGTLDITTSSINVENDSLTANIINIHAVPNANLNIDGGLNGGTFNSTVSTTWSASGNGDIILSGVMTMNGETFITTDNTGEVRVNNLADYTGNDAVTVTTGRYTIVGNGRLAGDPLTFDITSRTIANSNGNVTLDGDIIFVGGDYAIIASENINFGTATNISLANGAGNGGNLTMIAGYNFSPATSGQENSAEEFTFDGTQSTKGGSIDMTGVTISLNGTGNGGNLLVVAQGQTGVGSNAGTVVLGNVNTFGGVNGGAVTVLASGGIETGSLVSSGGSSGVGGSITLNVGNTALSSGIASVENGVFSGPGAFGITGATSGNISFATGNAGTGDFTATTAGNITASSALSAHNITLTADQLNFTSLNTLASAVDANGNSGDINVTASAITSQGSPLALVAAGTGAGDGGDINLTLNNSTAVTVGAGGSVQFDTSADGTGNGGTATFISSGAVTLANGAFVGSSAGGNGGGAVVDTTGNINVQAGAFDLAGALDGATISLSSDGTIDLSSGIGFFSQANAVGTDSNGGTLVLRGASFVLPAGVGSLATPLNLTATANGNGNNGTIVFETNSTTAMVVGASTGKAPKGAVLYVQADASGGGGNAGSITLATGGDLIVNDVSLLNASSSFTAVGALEGASYSLTAGRNGVGNLIVNGALNGSGFNSGVGGDITLASNSKTAFAINTTKAPKNGTLGAITTDNGGAVTISNLGGGITLSNAGAVVADSQAYDLGGKGTFSAKKFTINALDDLTITSSGTSALSNLSVNTASLSVSTGGAVSITNEFVGNWNLENATGKSITINSGASGSVTVNDVLATAGNVLIVNNSGDLTVAADANLRATNGSMTLQNTNLSGHIQVGANAVVETFGTKGKNTTLTVSSTIPKNGTNPTSVSVGNINVTVEGKGLVYLGASGTVVAAAPVNVNALNKNVIFNGPAGSIVLGAGSTITADPPSAATSASAARVAGAVPSVAAALPAQSELSTSGLFGFVGENLIATADLSVANLNAAPLVQVANNASLITTAGGIHATPTMGDTEDNSYMVGFMGNGFGETEAALCSDAEILGAPAARRLSDGNAVDSARSAGFQPASENVAGTIQTVQHSDRVVIKKGNVLFVPFKATTVETPNGIVHIDAKSVALVSSSDAGLAVYDLEDQHKGSISVESNGHNVVLAPGRHVMITKHHTAEFAQINAVETIAHRNVQSVVKNGHRAHTSEFSVLTAMDTVKPLKALAMSKHANAKQIADRMMKTTAIILQLGGGSGGQYQHYFKPRLTAKM
jgi:hypothetical protein